MKNKTLVLTAILLSSASALAAQVRPRQAVMALGLALDGTAVGFIKKAEGGYQKSSALSEKLGPDQKTRKHAAAPTIEPLTLSLGSTVDRSFFDWLNANWSGTPQTKTLALTACDSAQNAQTQTSYTKALPFEVTVPALDAASKEVCIFTVKVAPESVTTTHSGGKCGTQGAEKSKPWKVSDFRLDLDGVDGSGVSAIDSFTVKTTLTTSNVGIRGATVTPSAIQFPDLHLTVDGKHAQDFVTWFNDFIVQGQNDAGHEKKGAIVLLDATKQKELGRISLSGVGILNAAQPSSDSDDYAVDLYVEGMTLSLGR